MVSSPSAPVFHVESFPAINSFTFPPLALSPTCSPSINILHLSQHQYGDRKLIASNLLRPRVNVYAMAMLRCFLVTPKILLRICIFKVNPRGFRWRKISSGN